MTAIDLDVRWADDPDLIDVGLAGAGLHASCLCLIARLQVPALTASQIYRYGGTPDLVADLLEVGLLTLTDDGLLAPSLRGAVLPRPDDHVRRERARVTRAVRAEVFAADGHACRYCGDTEPLEVDHIYPLILGGTSDRDNLQTLCMPCNRRKWAHVEVD